MKTERENLVDTDNISNMRVWITSNVTLTIANFWVLTPCILVDKYKSETLAALTKGYMTGLY